MAVESHLAYGDEPESPRSGGGFELAEKRLGERELAHTVIWKRNRNEPVPEQPKPAVPREVEPPKVVVSKPESAAHAEPKPGPAELKIDHKADSSPAAASRAESPDPLKLPELPQVPTEIRRSSHESAVRQPNPAEAGHDGPSPTSASEVIPNRVPQSESAGAHTERSTTGEQLQHIAEQTAERASELADRHRTSPEKTREHAESKSAPEKLLPESRSNEHASNGAERQMRVPELLKLSQSIRVEGVSVAEMFAARRIDEEGLRRIVTEFLRGRTDIEKVITEEVVRWQLKYELDPQLRHQRSLAGSTAAGKAAGRLMEETKKLANPKHAKRRAARLSSFARDNLHEAKEIINENPQAAKIAGGIAIVVIYVIVLALLLTR